MTFAALAHVVIDVLTAPGRSESAEYLGGAGLYAAIGLRMGTRDPVVPLSGVGVDLLDRHGDFFARWELDTTGLDARSARTPRTMVTYHRDGGRHEQSLLGEAHFASMAPRLTQLADGDACPSGLYVFHDADPRRWFDVIARRRATGCVVMWELSADERGPAGWRWVVDILSDVDIVSVNVDEARALVGDRGPGETVALFVRGGASIVVLRAGEHGSYVGTASMLLHIAPTPAAIVDPTGAGNTYSGAFLGTWVATGSLERAGRTAAAAASFVLEQFGPPPTPPTPEGFARRLAATTARDLGN